MDSVQLNAPKGHSINQGVVKNADDGTIRRTVKNAGGVLPLHFVRAGHQVRGLYTGMRAVYISSNNMQLPNDANIVVPVCNICNISFFVPFQME